MLITWLRIYVRLCGHACPLIVRALSYFNPLVDDIHSFFQQGFMQCVRWSMAKLEAELPFPCCNILVENFRYS